MSEELFGVWFGIFRVLLVHTENERGVWKNGKKKKKRKTREFAREEMVGFAG